MSRLDLSDNALTATVKMSEGNPGALNVCCLLLKYSAEIDPNAAFGGFHCLLEMDDLGIYGSRIWMFFKDVCGQSLPKMVGMLRARQLGYVDRRVLLAAIEDYGRGLNVDVAMAEVTESLPRFRADWVMPKQEAA